MPDRFARRNAVSAVLRHLLPKTFNSFLVVCLAVTVCYAWVDRPVAWFVFQHHVDGHRILKWLTYPPPILQAWIPLMLTVLVLGAARRPLRRTGGMIVAACVGVVLADQFRESLMFVFGRYWPETWINNNPSLIGTDAYGFHPFHAGSAYGSFPSGHAARLGALAGVLWHALPRWRWLTVAVGALMCLALVGMNFHFMSDVIAGAWLGAVVGVYTLFCGTSVFCEDHALLDGRAQEDDVKAADSKTDQIERENGR
jgi:membrane-associated phospholipid phosphatase